MKIKEITEEAIIFDNGNTITFWHEQCCCEENFADFAQLDDIARNTEFDKNLDFEFVEEQGFRFGNQPDRMFFVPCYSVQNGYYSYEITIMYNGVEVLSGTCDGPDSVWDC